MLGLIKDLNRHFKFVLVSGSPRRRSILEELGLKFSVRPNLHLKENIRDFFYAKDIVRTAYQKLNSAKTSAKQPEIRIACDTIVVYNYRVFGKPKNKAQAAAFLRKLSGRKHTVVSCIALKLSAGPKCKLYHRLEKTKVYFRKLTAAEIQDYVNTAEPYDKAGGYGIQGLGKYLVRKINGCYYNVVGLPVAALLNLLNKIKGENNGLV